MNIENIILLNRQSKGLEYILYKLLREWEFYSTQVIFKKKSNNLAKLLESKFYSYLFNSINTEMFNTAQVRLFYRNNKRYYLVILKNT